jgi:hypothetical protein
VRASLIQRGPSRPRRDFEDAKGLVRSMNLDLGVIEGRYNEERLAGIMGAHPEVNHE